MERRRNGNPAAGKHGKEAVRLSHASRRKAAPPTQTAPATPPPGGKETDMHLIACEVFRPELEQLDHEECWAVYLSSSNRIIERQRISQGGVQGTVVDHRLIVKRALELLATQLILVHNHPSGSAEASEPDRMLTARIAQAAALFDIRLLDHIIVARAGSFSFRSAGLL